MKCTNHFERAAMTRTGTLRSRSRTACLELSAAIEAALGRVVSRQATPEMVGIGQSSVVSGQSQEAGH